MPFRNAFLVAKNFLFEEAHLIGGPKPSIKTYETAFARIKQTT